MALSVELLIVACTILSFVDATASISRPPLRNLMSHSSQNCISAFYSESLQVENGPPAVRLGLVHRYGPCSPTRSTTSPFGSEIGLTSELLLREDDRVRYIQAKMVRSQLGASELQGAEANLTVGSGSFLIKVGLGTPAKELLLGIDTGSELMWTQCLPCACFNQTNPIFDPTSSSTYELVPCGGQVCSSLGDMFSGGCAGRMCAYQAVYLDGSFSVGSFATDALKVGRYTVDGFQFGCGHVNAGLLEGLDGLMGLDKGPNSFPSQTSATFGQLFAYCLPSPLKTASGFIEFGTTAAPSATRTPMTTNSSLYVAQLSSVTVGATRLALFSASAPVIVDSGTFITRLDSKLYRSLRDKFKAGVSGLTPASAPLDYGFFRYLLHRVIPELYDTPNLFQFRAGSHILSPCKQFLVSCRFGHLVPGVTSTSITWQRRHSWQFPAAGFPLCL